MEEKEILEKMRQAKPSWKEDDKGIKGDAVVISNTKANLNWETKVTIRRPNIELAN